MADGIQITLDEVSQVANTIRSLNASMTACLEEIRAQMNALVNYFESEGSENIRAKFNMHAEHFEEYRTVIDSYAKFLDDTVMTYQTVDDDVKGNAEMFT